VQSLVRALRLLNHVSEADDGISLTDVAHAVGLPPSTAHRLLSTLQQEGYVRFDHERIRWLVGVRAFVTGNAFLKTRDLVRIARPYMRHLMEESGETVNLAVEDSGQVVYLSQVECRQMMRALASPGARVPLHCSAVGKALLASMAEPRQIALLNKQALTRLSTKTIVTRQALAKELARTAQRGYAIDDEEHAVGLRCVAAVICDEVGEPTAALSLSGPMARIPDDRLPELGLLVRRAADKVTRDFGGKLSGL
jgi:IclR family transcriptional regulator, acetate operon repressor